MTKAEEITLYLSNSLRADLMERDRITPADDITVPLSSGCTRLLVLPGCRR